MSSCGCCGSRTLNGGGEPYVALAVAMDVGHQLRRAHGRRVGELIQAGGGEDGAYEVAAQARGGGDADVHQNCVEVATAADGMRMRESDEPEAVIHTSPAALRAFIRAAKAGGASTAGESPQVAE